MLGKILFRGSGLFLAKQTSQYRGVRGRGGRCPCLSHQKLWDRERREGDRF